MPQFLPVRQPPQWAYLLNELVTGSMLIHPYKLAIGENHTLESRADNRPVAGRDHLRRALHLDSWIYRPRSYGLERTAISSPCRLHGSRQ